MPTGTSFVHLHLHSDYSLLDGTCRVKDCVRKAAATGQPAVAITDHGVMYGMLPFQKAAKDAGVKPIFGCEIYMTRGSRHEKGSGRSATDLGHLVLLAENETGYHNLIRLVSASHIEGFYYKPRTDWELLSEYHEGLIALSACLHGEIPMLLLRGQKDEAKELAGRYCELLGKDNFFLEIQDHGIPDQKTSNPLIIELAREMNIPLIASNDVHYLNQEDAEAHDVLLCIQTSSQRDDPKRLRFFGDQFFMKTPEEMEALFGDYPDALTNTLAIAERCNVTIETGGMILADYPVPIEGMSLLEYLRKLCFDKLPERFPNPSPEIIERLEKELEVVAARGIESFILMAWDIIDFARKNDILVGPGRGSAAGVLMLYILGVTEVNPVALGLPFERWINLERKSMPDIDSDFEPSRRHEVIQYIAQKYGSERVAQIITFGTIGARQALRDAGRVLRYPMAEIDALCKRISFNQSLGDFLDNDSEIRREQEKNAELSKFLQTARTIEGLARHAGTHAGGVVIGQGPLTDIVPLQRPTGGVAEKHQKNAEEGSEVALQAMTQFDKVGVEEIGLVKMDVLGLRTLGVLRECLRLIKLSRSKDIDISTLPLDDKLTYELLSRGDTNGVFQLESAGMKQVLRDLKPDRFSDIIAVVALYRPGPMAQIPNYIEGKHGRRKVIYPHPELEPTLADTFGIIVFQEQVMEIARRLAGFSLGRADALLKAMSKKKRDLMASLEEDFMRGAAERGIAIKIATDVFQQMNEFASYGFNKAHSACYALGAYQTAYLKANYAPEYLAAQLSSMMDNKEKSAALMEECRRIKVDVLPPDINASEDVFTVEEGKVRFGLTAIKHLGANAIEAILESRRSEGSFKDYGDFCKRIPAGAINRMGMEVLAKSGALCSLNMTRAGVMAAIVAGIIPGKAAAPVGQESLFGGDDEIDVMGPLPTTEHEFPLSELLSMEKELLGLYLSDHPLNAVRDVLEHYTTTTVAGLAEMGSGEATLGGVITELRRHTDRSGKSMAFATLEDFTGIAELTAFSETFQRCREAMDNGAVVLVRGKVEVATSDDDGELTAAKMVINDIALITDVKARERIRSAKTQITGRSGQNGYNRSGASGNGKPAYSKDGSRPNGNGQRPNGNGSPANENGTRANGFTGAPAQQANDNGASSKPSPAAETVHIRFASTPEALEEVKRLIRENQGSTEVMLHLETGVEKRVLKLGPQFAVQPTDSFLSGLRNVLGDEMAWVDKD